VKQTAKKPENSVLKAIDGWFEGKKPWVVVGTIVVLAFAFGENLHDLEVLKGGFDWVITRGCHIEEGGQSIVSYPWLFGVSFVVILTWFIWVALLGWADYGRRKATRLKDERQTTAFKTLTGMMEAASLIRDKLHSVQATPRKSLKSVKMTYLIHKDLMTEVTREYEVEAVSDSLHYWNGSNKPTGHADAVDYLSDIDFKVREGSGFGEIVYLPTRNDPRDKRVTYYFLPRIEPGAPARKLIISFKWPGYLRQMYVDGKEEISISLDSAASIPKVSVAVYLEPGLERNLTGTISGPEYAGGKISYENHPDRRWPGFVYQVENTPPGPNRYQVTGELVAPS
jgi:hypothetical protein